MALVTAVFGAATISVMAGLVYAGIRGARRWSAPGLERFAHAGSGLALTACGLAMKLELWPQDSKANPHHPADSPR